MCTLYTLRFEDIQSKWWTNSLKTWIKCLVTIIFQIIWLFNNIHVTLVPYHEKYQPYNGRDSPNNSAKGKMRDQINTRQAKMSQIWLVIFVYVYCLRSLSSLIKWIPQMFILILYAVFCTYLLIVFAGHLHRSASFLYWV